jgi:Baseplate J-like protein
MAVSEQDILDLITTTTLSVNYVEQSYEDIFYTLLTNAYSAGLLSNNADFMELVLGKKNIENDLILTLSTFANVLARGYQDLTKVYNAKNLDRAVGRDLDILGGPFLPRRPAAASVTDITFNTHSPAPNYNITIPVGTKISSNVDASIQFETTIEATLIAGQFSIDIPTRCTILGPGGDVPADTLTNLVYPIPDIISVTNAQGSSGGVDQESDDSYRLRIGDWRYILEKGTYNAILDAIGNVSAVNGFYIEPYWDGKGTVLITIDPPQTSVLDSINFELDKVKAVDEDYTVMPVELVPVNVYMEMDVDIDQITPIPRPEKDLLALTAQSYAKVYLDGGLNSRGKYQKPIRIGTDFVPFELEKFVSDQIPALRNIRTTYPLEPITILPSQRATAGEINITVI